MTIRFHFMLVAVVLSLSVQLLAARAPVTESGAIEFRFNNPREDVVVTYGQLAQRVVSSRAQFFGRLTASMQADLWTLHIQYFVEDRDELTARQLIVVADALRFIRSNPFSVAEDDPERTAKVDIPIANLARRALASFGAEEAFAAFAHLGPNDSTRLGVVEPMSQAVVGTGVMPDCECATTDDWCCVGPDCATSPTPKCHGAIDRCLPHSGCGRFWQSACNGLRRIV
jgi:hypothetical protein